MHVRWYPFTLCMLATCKMWSSPSLLPAITKLLLDISIYMFIPDFYLWRSEVWVYILNSHYQLVIIRDNLESWIHWAFVNHFFRLTCPVVSTAFFTWSLPTVERYFKNSLVIFDDGGAVQWNICMDTSCSNAWEGGQKSRWLGGVRPYAHKHLPAAPYHSDATSVHVHRCRSRGTDLITDAFIEHCKCEYRVSGCIGVYACNKQAESRVRQC